MCNAWNHRPDCFCGWGGESHLGRRAHGRYLSGYGDVPPIFPTYESYVNPNAKCPVCGDAVFFYQSPTGGRVFFDELGPPWPKHPCTDNQSIPKEIDSLVQIKVRDFPSREYRWQKNGWHPFYIKNVSRIDKFVLKISGVLIDRNIDLYVNQILNHHSDDFQVSTDNIFQCRKHKQSDYQLSIVGINGENVCFKAYLLLSEARKDKCYEHVSRRHKRRNKQRNIVANNKNQKPNSSKPKKKAFVNNAMELAFEKAKKRKYENKS